jgi:hypothetical protein
MLPIVRDKRLTMMNIQTISLSIISQYNKEKKIKLSGKIICIAASACLELKISLR